MGDRPFADRYHDPVILLVVVQRIREAWQLDADHRMILFAQQLGHVFVQQVYGTVLYAIS
ncbi:hypothetical protein D3C84_1145910 [compost metagenome]